MPTKRKDLSSRDARRRIALRVRQRLALAICLLIALLLLLTFKLGQAWWPAWMVDHRTQIMGLIMFALLFLILLSPIMMEASRNPRRLSGPGKNPKGPRLE